jgi:hypothetical protein
MKISFVGLNRFYAELTDDLIEILRISNSFDSFETWLGILKKMSLTDLTLQYGASSVRKHILRLQQSHKIMSTIN